MERKMEIYGNNEQLPPKEINLLDYWRIIWKRRWLIAVIAAVSSGRLLSNSIPAAPEPGRRRTHRG